MSRSTRVRITEDADSKIGSLVDKASFARGPPKVSFVFRGRHTPASIKTRTDVVAHSCTDVGGDTTDFVKSSNNSLQNRLGTGQNQRQRQRIQTETQVHKSAPRHPYISSRDVPMRPCSAREHI